jgi:hypothetical protein
VNDSSDAANAPGAAKPGRRTSAPRAEKSRVTTVEVDGAVLADEGAAPAKAPGRPPTRPRPKPAGAVRAGDAILAE